LSVASELNAITHRVEPDPARFVEELERLVVHQGAPIESPSVYAQWCVMRRAKEEGVTVLLDGQGADETWGGYPKYLWLAVADASRRGRVRDAERLLRTWRRLGALPPLAARQVGALGLARPARAVAVKAFTAAARTSLGPALRDVEPSPPELPRERALLQRGAAADLKRILLPRLLRYADRNSMAWSRELRLPFLDPDLAALGLRTGWSVGLAHGWTKYGLRRAAAERLPAEIVWRREKTAYETPDQDWLRLPAVAAAVADARRSLAAEGLLQPSGGGTISPWRILSLALLMRAYALAT
jgi:asparagine synthase (glutamine-hydrolysing)